MKVLTILLSLGAAVSATDAIMYLEDVGCSQGKWIGCLNLNPDVCCSLDNGLLGLSAVPSGWNIVGSAHAGQNCPGNPNFQTGVSDGRGCMPNEIIRSVGYGFAGRKMARGIETEEPSKCTEFKKADTVGLEDGTMYSLDKMTETEKTEFFGSSGRQEF